MITRRARLALSTAGLTAAALVAVSSAGLALTTPGEGWQSYRGAIHGYQFSYPAELFAAPEGGEKTDADSLLLISRDGKARLLAEAFWNGDAESLTAYRDRLLAEVYPGARLDYAPTRANWFVVSGIKDGQMFYHRTTFTCGGRLVSSWAMAYPVAERALYDRVVEGIARRHLAARGPAGDCRQPPEAVGERAPTPAGEPRAGTGRP